MAPKFSLFEYIYVYAHCIQAYHISKIRIKMVSQQKKFVYLVIFKNGLVRVKVLAPHAEEPLADQAHLKRERERERLNTEHWNTESFELQFPITRWPPFCPVLQWSQHLMFFSFFQLPHIYQGSALSLTICSELCTIIGF